MYAESIVYTKYIAKCNLIYSKDERRKTKDARRTTLAIANFQRFPTIVLLGTTKSL